jgi:hypothetical protein
VAMALKLSKSSQMTYQEIVSSNFVKVRAKEHLQMANMIEFTAAKNGDDRTLGRSLHDVTHFTLPVLQLGEHNPLVQLKEYLSFFQLIQHAVVP